MTIYTFNPNSTTTTYYWDNPASWLGGVVPNGPDADVVLPLITTSTGAVYKSDLIINTNESFTVRSVAVSGNNLDVTGGLAIQGALRIDPNSSFMAGTNVSFLALNNMGVFFTAGTISSPSAIVNDGTIIGGGHLDFASLTNNGEMIGNVTIDAYTTTFTNNGTLNNGVEIDAPNGGFTNFNNGTLTGGIYTNKVRFSNPPVGFNVGGFVTTLAASIILTDDNRFVTPSSYDAANRVFVPLQQTLQTIAATGSLTLDDFDYETGNLTVQGQLLLDDAPKLVATQLSVAAGGLVTGTGTITGPIVDDGTITASGAASSLLIAGAVSGTGTLVVGPATPATEEQALQGTSLELTAADSANVVFADRYGTLKVDQPTALTGTIAPSGFGDVVELVGINLNAITGYSYTGDSSGGVLTLALSGGATQNLRFVGDFTRDSFVLTNVPQPLSNSPPVLAITERQVVFSGTSLAVDGSQGVQTLVGTASPNFVNTIAAAGSGTVLVDLKDGTVSRGSLLDARLSNIQGVQLGADPSVVLGLASGTDLLYGGGGADSFYNEGGIDYIKGGTASNQVVGGSGTQIFYGNGGTDIMLGGAGDTFMQAGSTAGSVDKFFGNGGRDFVYGGAGATTLVGGGGTDDLTGGSGVNTLVGSTSAAGFDILNGTTGTDVFYGGIGTNLFYEGSGRGGSGNLNRWAEWSFCLTAARMVAEQERR